MRSAIRIGLLMSMGVLVGGGCPGANVNIQLDQAVQNIDANVSNIETTDVTELDLPDDAVAHDDDVVVASDAVVITDVRQDFVVRDAADLLVLGFENVTGNDIFVDFEVDGEFQSVLVLDGETVLIEYPCIAEVHLLSEDDFDVVTGDFVDTFDLTDFFYTEGDDYLCGDLLVLTIDPGGIAPHAAPSAVFDQ